MIKVTITPRTNENIYSLLIQKELSLRKQNKGTLHRYGPKVKDKDKWGHSSYNGWITFQRCLGGIVIALIQAKNSEDEWQLLTSFIGFLHRHFSDSISNIILTYGSEEE